MPPVANPNPDRARRADAPATPAAPEPTRVEDLPRAVAPTTTITLAPAQAPAAAAHALTTPRPSPAAPTGVFGIMPIRATGLQQSSQSAERKRTASVVRDDPAWQCVEITDETDAHSPRWKCLGCGAFRSGGATRIVDHVLGRKGSAKCSGTDETFLSNVEKVKKNETAKESKKAHKKAIVAVNASAAGAVVTRPADQPPLSFGTSLVDSCDNAIAELLFTHAISRRLSLIIPNSRIR